MKGTKRYVKILLVVFLRKNLIGGNLNFLGHFLFDWVWSKLSQTTVNIGYLNRQDMISFVIATGSLNSQDMIKILKQPGYDFSGKRLCDGYSDIMWCLSFVKKLL